MFAFPGRVLRQVGCSGRVWVAARGSRVFARRPVRVHLTGAAKEAEDVLRHYEEKVSDASGKLRGTGRQENEQKTRLTTQDKDASLRNSICFKLLSEAKDYERKLLENVKSRKYRIEHQLFVAEGYRIIREALQGGATPKAIYFTRLKLVAALRAMPSKLQLQDVHALSNLPLFRAPYKILQTWSSVTTSPGIVGVFEIPKASDSSSLPTTTTTTLPLTLVLDEIREPGNLGGVLRTAAAVGVQQVLLLKGCCDPWENKVVRAGCGAHFRLKLTTDLAWSTLSNYMLEDAQVFLADVCRAEDLVGDMEEEEEEKSQAADTHKDEKEHVDSLDIQEDIVYEVDEEGKRKIVDHSYNDPHHLELYSHVRLPTLSYDQLGLRGAEGGVVLVIGGEVGVSNAAKKFVSDNFGNKVNVPLANGMDSLNVGVASGVILYEMQKQLHRIAIQRVHEERHENGS